MNKLKTLLIGLTLAFSANASHDMEQQIEDNSIRLEETCTKSFEGQTMTLSNGAYFCDTEDAVIFYYPSVMWKDCLVTSGLYANAVSKQPGCMLLTMTEEQVDQLRNLKLEFYQAGVALFIFRLYIEQEHDEIINLN